MSHHNGSSTHGDLRGSFILGGRIFSWFWKQFYKWFLIKRVSMNPFLLLQTKLRFISFLPRSSGLPGKSLGNHSVQPFPCHDFIVKIWLRCLWTLGIYGLLQITTSFSAFLSLHDWPLDNGRTNTQDSQGFLHFKLTMASTSHDQSLVKRWRTLILKDSPVSAGSSNCCLSHLWRTQSCWSQLTLCVTSLYYLGPLYL